MTARGTALSKLCFELATRRELSTRELSTTAAGAAAAAASLAMRNSMPPSTSTNRIAPSSFSSAFTPRGQDRGFRIRDVSFRWSCCFRIGGENRGRKNKTFGPIVNKKTKRKNSPPHPQKNTALQQGACRRAQGRPARRPRRRPLRRPQGRQDGEQALRGEGSAREGRAPAAVARPRGFSRRLLFGLELE